MPKLAIVGAGFAATSLALALRPAKLFDSVAGWDRERGRLQAAGRLGAIDREERSPAAAVEAAAVIVVDVPPAEIEGTFTTIAPGLSAGAVVTDVTLWRVAAERAAAVLPEGVHFVGGRPVLDGAGDGPEQASAGAFRNAVYCLTPGPAASEAAVNTLATIATAAGAQPYFLEPAEHDALTAAGEQLPHALLASLLLGLSGQPSWPEAGKLAGDTLNRAALLAETMPSGFWQTAAGNAPALSRWLEDVSAALLSLRDRLLEGDDKALAGEWDQTLQGFARWRGEKRQLRDRTMPSPEELRPNLLGVLGRRRG